MIHKIIYASFIRYPSEKAHALYVAKSCEAFVTKVADVELIVPNRFGSLKTDHQAYYSLKQAFKLVRLHCIDLVWLPWGKALAHQLGLFTFGLYLYFRLWRLRLDGETVCISNDAWLALMMSFTKARVVYEIHDYPSGMWWLYRLVARRAYKIQTNNQLKVAMVIEDMQVPADKVYAVHNGVTIEDFDVPVSKDEARHRLGLELDKKFAVYTGHLYAWKGAHVLAEAAKLVPEVEVLFVGGTLEDVRTMRAKYADQPNLHFLGHKKHSEIPYYLKAADVLVLPNSAKSELSLYHTSPMKLIEYIASKRPIVASDIPSIRELLNDDNATLVLPDNPKLLSNGISSALNGQCDQTRLGIDAQQFSWENRVNSIIRNL